MLKRKCSTLKTLTKNKQINSHWGSKKTVKKYKMKNIGRQLQKKEKKETIFMEDRLQNYHEFNLEKDS